MTEVTSISDSQLKHYDSPSSENVDEFNLSGDGGEHRRGNRRGGLASHDIGPAAIVEISAEAREASRRFLQDLRDRQPVVR